MSFVEYLINKGYKPYRYVYNKSKNDWEYIYDDNINYYSSCVPGYLDIRLLKDKEEIIYGLHEINHSPLLIYPRLNLVTDSQVDRLFIEKSYDKIYNLIKKQYESNSEQTNSF